MDAHPYWQDPVAVLHVSQANQRHPPLAYPAAVMALQSQVLSDGINTRPCAAQAQPSVKLQALFPVVSMQVRDAQSPPAVKVPELTAHSDAVLEEQLEPLQQRPVAQQEQDI
jgi:hypothetical protein